MNKECQLMIFLRLCQSKSKRNGGKDSCRSKTHQALIINLNQRVMGKPFDVSHYISIPLISFVFIEMYRSIILHARYAS